MSISTVQTTVVMLQTKSSLIDGFFVLEAGKVKERSVKLVSPSNANTLLSGLHNDNCQAVARDAAVPRRNIAKPWIGERVAH